MNFFNFLKAKRALPPKPSSPEEMIELRLESVRVRSNRLKMERALFDILAVALAVMFAWYILRRTVSLHSLILYLCAGALIAFAIFRLLRVRQWWTDKEDAAALIDGEMKLKQRLVTFIEYAAHRVKPRLYDRLADEIIFDLSPGNIRKILPRRVPPSAYVALAIALAFSLDMSLKLSAPDTARTVTEEGRKEDRLALREDEQGGEKPATPTPESKADERGGKSAQEEIAAKGGEPKQLAQMRQDLHQMMQNISRQLDRMEQGAQGSGGGASGGKSPQSESEPGSGKSPSGGTSSSGQSPAGKPPGGEQSPGGGGDRQRAGESPQSPGGQRGGESPAKEKGEKEKQGQTSSSAPATSPQTDSGSSSGLQTGDRSPGGGGGMGTKASGAAEGARDKEQGSGKASSAGRGERGSGGQGESGAAAGEEKRAEREGGGKSGSESGSGAGNKPLGGGAGEGEGIKGGLKGQPELGGGEGASNESVMPGKGAEARSQNGSKSGMGPEGGESKSQGEKGAASGEKGAPESKGGAEPSRGAQAGGGKGEKHATAEGAGVRGPSGVAEKEGIGKGGAKKDVRAEGGGGPPPSGQGTGEKNQGPVREGLSGARGGEMTGASHETPSESGAPSLTAGKDAEGKSREEKAGAGAGGESKPGSKGERESGRGGPGEKKRSEKGQAAGTEKGEG